MNEKQACRAWIKAFKRWTLDGKMAEDEASHPPSFADVSRRTTDAVWADLQVCRTCGQDLDATAATPTASIARVARSVLTPFEKWLRTNKALRRKVLRYCSKMDQGRATDADPEDDAQPWVETHDADWRYWERVARALKTGSRSRLRRAVNDRKDASGAHDGEGADMSTQADALATAVWLLSEAVGIDPYEMYT